MIIGLFIAIIGFLADQCWKPIVEYFQSKTPSLWARVIRTHPQANEEFFFSHQELFFIAMVLSGVSYIVISFLSKKPRCNLDKILHQGEYAVEAEPIVRNAHFGAQKWKSILGFSKYFTVGDKIIYFVSYLMVAILLGMIIIGAICSRCFDITDEAWLSFWHIGIWVTFACTLAVITWLTVGGFRDLSRLFRNLAVAKRDDSDDGTVIHGRNLSDETDCGTHSR